MVKEGGRGGSNDWRRHLAAGPECLPVERFAATLTDAERQHVEACARCQAEHALWRAFDEDKPLPEEEADVAWIAAETKRRISGQPSDARNRAISRKLPSWLAAAAAIVLAAGAAALWFDRAPGIGGAPSDSQVYRTGNVELLQPIGDVATAPTELSWAPVEGATSYEARLMEVDGHVLWSSTSSEPRLLLPENVRQFAVPAKTLLWEVTGRDRNGNALARSDTGRFRVKGKPVPPGL